MKYHLSIKESAEPESNQRPDDFHHSKQLQSSALPIELSAVEPSYGYLRRR